MSTDFEQRLRAEMEQVEVSPRPGLVHEAYRSFRGQRRRTRGLAAAGTAVAVAAGTAAGVVAATASPAVIPAQTTAYVLSHVSSAIAASDDMSYTIITYGGFNPSSKVVGSISYTWEYGTRSRNVVDSGTGQPETDTWAQTGVGQTLVFYSDRVWARYGFTPKPWSFSCTQYALTFPVLAASGPENLSSTIKAGMRCGAFSVAGHQRVDGVDTIKLVGRSAYGHPTVTLWVNARTYLPVRGTGEGTVMQFRWLSPTQANLAHLTGTIPAGFRHSNN